MTLHCLFCETKIEIPDSTRVKSRITCPNCSAQLTLFKHKGEYVLGCAPCKDPTFDPALCDVCERRQERKSLLEEGRL